MNKDWREKIVLAIVLLLMAFVGGPTMQNSFENEVWTIGMWSLGNPLHVFFMILYAALLWACVKLHEWLGPSVFAPLATMGVALIAVLVLYFLAYAALSGRSTYGPSFEYAFRMTVTYSVMWEAFIMGVLTSIIARLYNGAGSTEPMVIPTRINSQTEPSA